MAKGKKPNPFEKGAKDKKDDAKEMKKGKKKGKK
jgi:hypothetical protein